MNGFMDTLRGVAHGGALDELTTEERALIEEVRSAQSAGELTLTVRYTPRGLHQVRVGYEIKVKRPKRDREESLFFFNAGESGEVELQRDDPRQGKLDIDPDVPRRSEPEQESTGGVQA